LRFRDLLGEIDARRADFGRADLCADGDNVRRRQRCRRLLPEFLFIEKISAYQCSHSIAISGDPWPDDLRSSDIEHRFVCEVCGKRGADVPPDFNASSTREQAPLR
jgi:hypothetical protein